MSLDPTDKPTPPQLRIGDAERHKAVDALAEAFAAGRLTHEEFDERTTSALVAKTAPEIAVLLIDLHPEAVTQVEALPPIQPNPGVHGDTTFVAVMGSSSRTGDWNASDDMRAFALMGEVSLDFRGAQVPSREIKLNVVAIMGEVSIVVPDDWSVTMSGIAIMGERKVRGERNEGTPTVHLNLNAVAIMGEVDVRHKPRNPPRKLK